LLPLITVPGIKSIDALRKIALPNPIIDFGDLPQTKTVRMISSFVFCRVQSLTLSHQISSCEKSLCIQCGNCTRCPYGAITMDIEDGYPKIDPAKCVGCSVCVLQCPAKALKMRKRTPAEAAMHQS